jgi:hypothetical protein
MLIVVTMEIAEEAKHRHDIKDECMSHSVKKVGQVKYGFGHGKS